MNLTILDPDNWREIGATLARNKTRTLLTAFGIFWGTAMLAILLGGGQGLQTLMRSNFAGFATNSGFIMPTRTTIPYHGYQKGMLWSLTQTDVDLLKMSIPKIEKISAVTNTNTTVRRNDRSLASSMLGIDDMYADIMNPVIESGRFLNTSDVANDRKLAVIGINVANELFGTADPIGEFIECDNVYYRVVGVASQKNAVSLNGRIDDQVIIPVSTFRRTYNRGDKVDMAMFCVIPGYTPTDIRPDVERVLRVHHHISPDDHNAMFFMDVSEMFEMVDNVFLGINVLLLFVGLSSLLAGIIGVGNIMWIIVKERTHEFGIRRAIGAKPRTVLTQIMSESAVLTVVAGLAGIVFAVLVLAVATKVVAIAKPTAEASFQLSFSAAIMIVALFLVLGSAAGTIPALKAMNIKPIEALNDK